MAALFHRLFNIERNEIARAVLMFLYAFLLLSAYLILKPVRNSLFLDKFGADQLVFMYMIIAAVATPVASFYGWTAARTSLPRLVGLSTIVIVINLAAFWYLISQQYSWLVYVFYVWVSLFGVFTTSQYWLLANYVFDPREAKRIFPFCAAGAIVGGMVGSLLTNLFAELVGTVNLLWLCMGFLLICFGILMAVWRMRQGDDPSRTKQKRKSRDISGMLSVISKSRHMALLAIMISLTVMVSTFVDFQFNKVVKDAFDDRDKLTAFFGSFFLWLSVASLVLQLLFSSRIIRRFGVGAAILFLPVGLLLGSAAIFVAPVLMSAVIVKLSDGSFRYSINKTGLELLYLPIPTNIKSRVKALLDVVGDRFARGIGGALLYLVNSLLAWSVQWISLLSAGLIAIWIAVAIMLRREYSRAFRDALSRRGIDAEQVQVRLQDPNSLQAIARTLESGDTRQVLFALEMTAHERVEALKDPLAALLPHQSAEVRKRALAQLVAIGDGALCDRVRPLLQDDDADVRTQAIRYLCMHTPGESHRMFREFIESDDPLLQASACRCALEYAFPSKTRSAFAPTVIEKILKREDDIGLRAKRQLASALKHARTDDPLAGFFARFLADPDSFVRREAIEGASALNKREFLPTIIGYLADPTLRGLATRALQGFGPSALGTLRDYMVDQSQPLIVRKRIPRVISGMPEREAAAILTAHLDIDNALLRYEVIRGLNRLRRSLGAIPVPGEDIKKRITDEARAYYTLSNFADCLSQGQTRAEELLLRAIGDRQNLHLEQIFRLSGLIYPMDDMYYAYNGIVSSARVVRARAIEFLDTVWDREEKRYLFPILEKNVRLDEAGRQLFKLPELSRDKALKALLTGRDAWLAACAAYVVGELRLEQMAGDLETLCRSDQDTVRETAAVALKAVGV